MDKYEIPHHPEIIMSKGKPKRSPAIYAILSWMIVNVGFYALELTVFNDAADLNNSVTLILMILSTVGLASMRRAGAFFATFSLSYSFAFNAFNVIYFSEVRLLNGVSAVTNAVAIVYMYTLSKRF